MISVATDANILINLIHCGFLGLLTKLPGYEFVVPQGVAEEVTEPTQKVRLQEAVNCGSLREERLTAIEELTLFADLVKFLGKGEAACLALAQSRGWLVASDERGAFRREVLTRLGAGRVVNTPGIFLLAIRAGVLTVNAADQAKALLEQRRFRMTFASFRDLLRS